MAPTNQAAWFPAEKVRPVQIGPAPYTAPGPGQIVVQNAALAINHVECYKQMLGNALLGYTKYPAILGGDIAGTVVEVGPGVQRFSVGDRVVAAALSLTEASNDPAEGGFQLYTLVREHLASPLPAHLSFERACVLPLTLSTAAYGLFHDEFLALDMPRPTPTSATTTTAPDGNKTDATRPAVLITAGASSLGANAVQLATAAGYDVVSTSSPKNFEFVRKLGAVAVVDYHNSATLVDDILAAVGDRTLFGAYAVGNGAVGVCAEVLKRAEKVGGKGRFVASAMPFTPEEVGSGGVEVKFVDLKDSAEPNGHVARVFTEFLPQALATGQFVPAPEPLVVGKGLNAIQGAMDRQLQGLSAQKLVVTL